MLCEIEAGAAEVLRTHFHVVPESDITKLDRIGAVDLVAAGFPCQDLSQAGGKRGIGGSQSGLVDHLFRLLREMLVSGVPAEWVLMENVSYMRRLDKGRALAHVTGQLEKRGTGGHTARSTPAGSAFHSGGSV